MDNRESFRSGLVAATLRAARSAATQFAAEGLYSFALYTSGEYNYVSCSVSTQAGLEQAASRYMADERFRRRWADHAVAMRQLKWSPCDSPHHCTLQDEFDAAGAWLDALWEDCQDDDDGDGDGDGDDYDDEDMDDAYSQLCDFVHQSCAEALGEVRRARIFSDAVTLNILMGDPSDEDRLANAASLNDPEVIERLRADLDGLHDDVAHEH
jgi:hypothetical protein